MLEEITLEQLKQMNFEQLELLAKEVRQEIITTVSKNGGHLASNLGVVELTIALHKVFDSPKDKLIFDVSHQTYAHKLLTGRYKDFSQLRKFEGISGFTKYDESDHDAFEAGHSSTAISAGLGYLEARKNFPEKIGEVVAIVGDASIANGLSFEALNYLGDHKDQKMIIIINDNAMGISKNVGSLARSYNNIRTKGQFKRLRKIIPLKIKKALKSTFYDISIFNSLGFQYFEKIDGHNFKELIKYLTYAKNCKESVVLHIMTQKGKGYELAENDKIGKWHGVSPFDIQTGEAIAKPIGKPYGNIIGDYLIDYVNTAENKELIRVITPAMSLGSGLTEFAKAHPEQFIDVGLAEENATLMASSMAHAGLIPILFIYSTFLQRSYDELLHDIGRSKQHVVICLDRAGIVESDGDTHQGIFDLAYLASIPGITIFSPSNATELITCLNYAINELNGPVVIRYPKQNIDSNYTIEKFTPNWHIIKESNNYIITYGRLVNEVKELIKNENLNIGLINAIIINPLDDQLLEKLANDGSTLYVYEEVISEGSLANRIILHSIKNNLKINVKMLNLPDTYLETGSRSELMEKYGISINDLKKVIGEEDVRKFNS